MNKKYIYECLLNIIDKEDIKLDEPMKKHISFRVGGPADILTNSESCKAFKRRKCTLYCNR